ncbi:DUF6152 family protein [Iningainema tapete]|uniref:Uncharacterized protein n=1 Tax=Iningainema tapete BLCC-T55 TaxID=2748662 RepID=A0A8J7BWZ8_9CYAN|nr:DUF6152 family protein [Iningainema tapete]MBD2771948.1 hypothetical protein [Iningainema tapete BLCC-T55]
MNNQQLLNNQQQDNKALKQAILHSAVTAASIATFLASASDKASAHHEWNEYNNQQTLKIIGEIQNINYTSSHTKIVLKTDDNKVWQAVLAPPARKVRRGLPQRALQIGQRVKLVGYAHLTDTDEMRAERIFGDRTVEMRK